MDGYLGLASKGAFEAWYQGDSRRGPALVLAGQDVDGVHRRAAPLRRVQDDVRVLCEWDADAESMQSRVLRVAPESA